MSMKSDICFLCLDAYPLLNKEIDLGYCGGGEKKVVLLGKELAKRKYGVTFITYYETEPRLENIDAIRVIKSYKSTSKENILKRSYKIWNCLRNANSNIYIVSSGFLGPITLFCRLFRKKYIYWIASDRTVQLKTINEKTSFVEKFYLYLSLKLSDFVFVQNTFQKGVIEAKFKKRCVLLKNPLEIPHAEINTNEKFNCKKVYWIATVREIKQPHIFLELAKNLPQFQFILVGGPEYGNRDLFDEIQESAAGLPNLTLLGFIQPDAIIEYLCGASLLVNTSKAEGFPNTFLEAWASYTPVVSLNVNPDSVLTKNKIGLCSGSLDRMLEDIIDILSDEGRYTDMCRRCREYAVTEHDVNNIGDAFESALDAMFEANSSLQGNDANHCE